MSGAATMARPKGRPRRIENPEPTPAGRATVINLKGDQKEAEWLESVHRATHLPKAVIVRLALSRWAEAEGHPAYPGPESEHR